MRKSRSGQGVRGSAVALVVAFVCAVALVALSPQASRAEAPVALGSAANFAVLAGSTVTNTGATTVTGDLGVSPGTAVTGFPPGTVTGTTHAGDPTAAQAQSDLTTAYNDAAGRTVGAVTVAGNLGGQTLTPGLYKSTSSLEISSGDLTLNAQGSANAVFIFQMASTLTTTAGRQVILSGGAQAANVFWQVGSSATLGTTSVFKGNILALTSISLATGATLDGRALARNGAVTLDTNTITTPAPVPCGDVNGDGVVNIGDALVVAQFDVGLRQCGVAPFIHPEVCDVNGDGACNIGDALRMAQCDVGLISCAFTCRLFTCP